MTVYPIVPVSKPRMTSRDKWKQRPAVMAYRAFKDKVRAHGVTIPVPCKVTFYIAMPDSWSKKKKAAMDGQPHMQKPDVDNLLKALLDALFEDDCAVWSIWPEKRWATVSGFKVESL